MGVAGESIVSIEVIEGVGNGLGDRVGVMGKGVGVAEFSIMVVEGVGKGLGGGVGELGRGMGVVGALFRLLLGLQSFLSWPCCLARLTAGVLIGSGEWGLASCW